MNENKNEEKISIQMKLSRLYDEWMISVTNNDLKASDRLWQEMGVIYQNLRNYISQMQPDNKGKDL
ncbi:MAG: hypothetical protein VX617_02385 [Pseudomonadota bacterium]|nr:hypothetical protein [Pseudomonadota bacterium]